ncbi:MAG: hypothetical protein KDB07_13910, partial [Planctomycetes bacterium]|nr:hypothetical protein [Planctomycetota bacterium]
MSTMPQVRIWGIVDLFLLLAVVLMIARVDALAEAEDTQDEAAQMRQENADLRRSLTLAEVESAQLRKRLLDSQGHSAEVSNQLDAIKGELSRATVAGEEAAEEARELSRQLETAKSALNEDFKAEEHIERYRQLREMVDVIEVTLDDASLIAIDQQRFSPESFPMVRL